VTLTLDSGGASFGCFLICGAGDTYCAGNSLATGTVITPLLFDTSGDTLVTGAAGSATVDLGTIAMVTSNGNNTGTVANATVTTLPSTATVATQTPAGLACPIGRWVMNTDQVQDVCTTGTGTNPTNKPKTGILTIAQNSGGSYTTSYIALNTQIGQTNDCGTQAMTLSGAQATYNAANSTVSYSFTDACQDLTPQIILSSGTLQGNSVSVNCTGGTCKDGNSVVAATYTNETVTYTPYGVLMGFLPPCNDVSQDQFYCVGVNGNGTDVGGAFYSANGTTFTPFTACTGSETTNCCVTTGQTAGSCYDGNGNLYGPTAKAGASNECASNPATVLTETSTMPINSACTEMQNSGPASGTNTTTGLAAFSQATDTETNCGACIQGNWGGQGGCLGVGNVTCGGSSGGSNTSNIEIWVKQ